jgi:NAD(P)-dependent dehydrogenase (short-subunit alcohol dehydrogenase family)
MKGLKKKRILIAGDCTWMGGAVARRFLKEGSRVACIGSDGTELPEYRGFLRGLELVVVTNLGNIEEVERAFRALDGRWGGLDILINNVMNSRSKTSLKDAFMLTRMGVDRMKARGGVIIALAQDNARSNSIDIRINNAIREWTRALAIEIAPNIRVNAVFPGNIKSHVFNTSTMANDNEEAIAKIPIGRYGEPDEVAALCLFLSSSEAEYITGQSFTVDGGKRALWPEN